MRHLINKYNNLISSYKVLKGKLEERESRKDQLLQRIEGNKKKLHLYEEAIEVAEAVGRLYQEQVFGRIDALVTQALRAIFDDDSWEFHTRIEYKRGQPEAYFEPTHYEHGKKIHGDLLFVNGGGVSDVISCALRLIVAEIAGIQGAIFFDEPARMLSAGYMSNFARFLKDYSEKTGRQIILITHSSDIASVADKSFYVTQDHTGRSVVSAM